MVCNQSELVIVSSKAPPCQGGKLLLRQAEVYLSEDISPGAHLF